MDIGFLQLLLRVDAAANIGLAVIAAMFRSRIADALALDTNALIMTMAVGLLLNGIWLISMAGSPRRLPVRIAAEIDLAFVALMALVAVMNAVEPWARVSAAVLAVVVMVIGLAKLVLSREPASPGGRVSSAIG